MTADAAAGRPIRVVLVDDQALFRAGIRMLVDSQPDLEVVAEAADGEQDLVGEAFDEQVGTADECCLGHERAQRRPQRFVVVLGGVAHDAGALVVGTFVDHSDAVAGVAVDQER